MNSFMQALEARVEGAMSPDHQKLAQMVMAMINQQDANGGGLSSLVQQFEKAGMGPLVQSWISNSANHPINAEQVAQVLGSEKVQQLAAQAGISPDFVKQALTMILPAVVDHATPQGTVEPLTAAPADEPEAAVTAA